MTPDVDNDDDDDGNDGGNGASVLPFPHSDADAA